MESYLYNEYGENRIFFTFSYYFYRKRGGLDDTCFRFVVLEPKSKSLLTDFLIHKA